MVAVLDDLQWVAVRVARNREEGASMTKLFNPERMTPRERVLAKYPRAGGFRRGRFTIIVSDTRLIFPRTLGAAGNAAWAWYHAAKNIEEEKGNG
jgi:hypothetical protein